MVKREELTDEQWAILKPLILKIEPRADRRGRPIVRSERVALNGVLWVLRTGAGWDDLPDRFPSGSICFPRCLSAASTKLCSAIHLEKYSAMDTLRDNMVYVVSLGSQAMREGGTHTWIDVVEKDEAYFHPVGNHWPQQPPNYIAFRYRGRLQSVHRIEDHEIWANVAEKNPLWCDTAEECFVYKLGPAMRPPRDLKAGGTGDSIKRSAKVWCAIDTLLNGQFDYLGQARDATKRRLREAETG